MSVVPLVKIGLNGNMKFILSFYIAFTLINFSCETNYYIFCDSCLKNPVQSGNICNVKGMNLQAVSFICACVTA